MTTTRIRTLTPTYTPVNVTSHDGGHPIGSQEAHDAIQRVKAMLQSTRRKGSRDHTPPKREEVAK
ncbi:MAG: hypothetical protein ACR2OE_14970 [Thermomicrobiales bacterium]